MNRLKKPDIDPGPIAEMVQGYRISHILGTSVARKVFNRLSDPKSGEALADEMGTDARTTVKFLNVLVCLGLLAKFDGKYFNTIAAETFLMEGRSAYMGNLIGMTVGKNKFFSFLDEALKKDGISQQPLQPCTFDEMMIRGNAEAALCHELPKIFETLTEVPEFVCARSILDLGGALGAYSMAFARMNPSTEITLFGLTEAIAMSKSSIAEQGMEDRIKTICGDVHQDDIGHGYDLVFASHLFYRKTGPASVLRKIYESLEKNGIVVLHHWVINESGTGPRVSALFDLYGSIRDRDFCVHTVNAYINFLKEAGFSKVRLFDIQTSWSPSMLVLGKKI